MKKLRIMWLHSHLSLSGGGVKYVLEVIRELSKNHDVDLYVQKALPQFEKQFKDAGINLTIMSKYSTSDILFWLNFSRQIKNEIHFLKQSSGIIVSGLRNRIYFPFASFNPWLQALAKPRFSSLIKNRIP